MGTFSVLRLPLLINPEDLTKGLSLLQRTKTKNFPLLMSSELKGINICLIPVTMAES